VGTAQRPVFGPNDFHLEAGQLMPGLGDEEEAKIRKARGIGAPIDEPPAKAELRQQAAALATKAKQLSAVERELEKERKAIGDELAAREAAVAEREALVAAQLRDLEGKGD
jgi:hypothetical protein